MPAPGEWLALSFAEPQAGLCGQVRVERGHEDAMRALIAVFARGEAIALTSASWPADADGSGPLRLAGDAGGPWSASFSGEGGEGAFTLTLQPSGEPLLFEPGGSEQHCRAHGEVVVGGRPLALDGLAQLGRGTVAGRGSIERDLAAWLSDGVLIAVRSTGADGGEHDGERIAAQLADAERPPETADEARLSTTYAGDGHPLRAGLELWPHEDSDYPRRAAGETVSAATVIIEPDGDGSAEPGLRWDVAFLDWRMEGRAGVGPYSVLRRR